MPDIEATAVATETPEAAPKPSGRQTDAERIAAAAEVMGKLEAKPFDPSLDAKKEAAGEPGTEEAPAEERAAQPDAPPVSEYFILKRRKEKLARQEEAFQAKATENEAKLAQFEADKRLLRENPKAFWAKVAAEHGSDFTSEYSKMADAYLQEAEPGAKQNAELEATRKKLDELEKKLADKDQENEKRARAHHERQVIGDFLRVATADEHKATSFTFRKYGEQHVVADALNVGAALAKELGRAATDGEIAKRLDSEYQKYYKDIVDSHSVLSTPQPGVTERVNGADQSAKPVAPKAPKTLTNGGSAERAAPARKLTERERIEAATKLLPG